MNTRIKRVYEPPAVEDGFRVLVDRLWPRGLKKSAAALDAWRKDMAPSDALRRWFGHDPSRWEAFRRRYEAELEANPEGVRWLLEQAQRGRLTLCYSAKDAEHNQAVVLRDYLLRKALEKPQCGYSASRL